MSTKGQKTNKAKAVKVRKPAKDISALTLYSFATPLPEAKVAYLRIQETGSGAQGFKILPRMSVNGNSIAKLTGKTGQALTLEVDAVKQWADGAIRAQIGVDKNMLLTSFAISKKGKVRIGGERTVLQSLSMESVKAWCEANQFELAPIVKEAQKPEADKQSASE